MHSGLALSPLHGAHLALVALSVSLFVARGVGVLAGRRLAMHAAVRGASVGIDTLLLASGVALWHTIGLPAWPPPWLSAKLALLVVYVVLGSIALRRARRPGVRAAAFAAALATVLTMLGIALTRDPAGWWVLATQG